MAVIGNARVTSGTGAITFVQGAGPTPVASVPTGTIGPTGPIGSPGVAGPTGPTGAIGPTGPSGSGGGGGSTIYDIIGYWRGLLPSDTLPIHIIELVRTITLSASLTGSLSKCLIAPTGAVSLNLAKNGASIGSIEFAASATTGTFIFTNPVTFVAGDIWQVDPPSPQDITFAGLSWTIIAAIGP